MDYVKMLEKENVGLKTTLKKILKDVDGRLKEFEGEETSDTEDDGQEGGGQLTPNNTFTYNNETYIQTINTIDNHTIQTTLTKNNETIQLSTLGFTTQRGGAKFLNPNTNETIEYIVKINNVPCENIGFRDIETGILVNSPDFTLNNNDIYSVTLTITDNAGTILATNTITSTYSE